MKHNLTFHTDPGHGWLEVPRNLLIESGIIGKVSRYSYQDTHAPHHVYLEEDCDASLFVDAMKAKGIEIDFKDSYSENTFVLRLHRFSA